MNEKFKGLPHLSFISDMLKAQRSFLERYKPLQGLSFMNTIETKYSYIDKYMGPFASSLLKQHDSIIKQLPEINNIYVQSLPNFD